MILSINLFYLKVCFFIIRKGQDEKNSRDIKKSLALNIQSSRKSKKVMFMKKMLIILALLTVSLLAACQSRIVGDDITGGVVGVADYGTAKEEYVGDEMIIVKEFHVVADKSIYRPSILEVDKGDSVRIVIYASNTNHGFVLPAYGINEFLEEDNYKTIEFVADQAGEFTFFSNVYSGPGTKDMKGTLVVNE